MADEDLLTKAMLVGTAKGIIGDTYDPGFDPDFFNVWCDVTIQPRLIGPAENAYQIRIQNPAHPMLVALTPFVARFETGVLRAVRNPAPANDTPTTGERATQNSTPGIPLLAETAELELPEDVHLVYDVVFGSFTINGARYKFDDFTFAAPTSDVTIDIARVERINQPPSRGQDVILRMIPDDVRVVDGNKVQLSSNGVDLGDPLAFVIPAAAISDSGATGRSVMQADTEAEARAAADADTYGAYEAARDGVTNDRAALAAADAAATAAGKPLMLLSGTHLVSSDLTITSPVVFRPGAKIKPASGVTVTLAGGMAASETSQVFDHSAGGKVVPLGANIYDVRLWGVKCDGSTEDTSAWSWAVASVYAAGGGLLRFAGTSLVDQIELRSKVGICGVGGYGKSIIKQKAGRADGHSCIKLVEASARGVVLRDFSVDGNKSNQTPGTSAPAIYFDGTANGATFQAKHLIENIHVYNVLGHGVQLGPWQWGSQVNYLTTYSCDGYGLYVAGLSDCTFDNIDLGRSGKDGLYIHGSGNCRFSNVKVWFSGEITPGSSGVLIRNGNTHVLSNITTQDNSGNGMLVYGAESDIFGLNVSGFSSSGDNTSAGTYHGLNIISCYRSNFDVTVAEGDVAGGTPYAGVSVTTSAGNKIVANIDPTKVTHKLAGAAIADNDIDLCRGIVATTPPSGAFTPEPYKYREHQVTLTANRTINNPGFPTGSPPVGMRFRFVIIQDGTGGWTPTFSSAWKLPATFAVDPAASARTILEFECQGSNDWALVSTSFDTNAVLAVKDSNFTIVDNADTTKKARLELSGITAGATRTYTLPDASVALVGQLTPEMFGAVGNGTTDDTTALNNCFAAAAGKTVYLTAGKSYKHTNIVTIGQDYTTVTGQGTLLATVETLSEVLVSGKYVTINGPTIKLSASTTRYNEYEKQKLRVTGDYCTVRNVTVDTSSAAGIYTMAGYFVYENVRTKNTQADGFFTSEGAHDGLIIGCIAENPGDDGFSVVSYAGTPCHHIVNMGSRVINGGARGFSVVGGQHVELIGPRVEGCQAAGLYLGAEGDGYDHITNVTVSGGVLLNTNQDTGTDHGAILITAWNTRNIQYVDIIGLAVRDCRTGASANVRVIRYDTSTIQDIAISGFPVAGGPATMIDLFQVTQAANRIYLSNVTRDGVPYYNSRMVTTVTGAVTGTFGVDQIVLLGSGASYTQPTAVANPARYTIKNIHNAVLSVATTGGQTIDGSSSIALTPNTSVDLISDGSNWKVL